MVQERKDSEKRAMYLLNRSNNIMEPFMAMPALVTEAVEVDQLFRRMPCVKGRTV